VRRCPPLRSVASFRLLVGSVALLALMVGIAGPVGVRATAGAAGAAPENHGAPKLPRLSSPIVPAPSVGGEPPVTGPMKAPGGPFLFDKQGRVVFLHGVNVVYKHPPYEVYPDPGKPWNFGVRDASLMARLGFDVVRLGMTWKGLEPGTAPANDRAICTPGAPKNPHQYNQGVLDRYLGRLKRTVDVLARFHIFTILDMHQDVYNELFDGEGAPNWAVCTDGLPNVDPPGRWSKSYGTAAAGAAFDHFWDNNVVGDLQGQFDLVWGKVARYFAHDPWVIGFDPFNEPFSTSLLRHGDEQFDAQLECFYTGTAHIGKPLHGAPRITCPSRDPAAGVVPTLLANDPNALVFDEPDNYASRGYPTYLGPMGFSRLVFNFHVYCGARSPMTGNPTNILACIAQERRAIAHRAEDRIEMTSSYQPGGPPWFMSEFGATSDVTLLSALTAMADQSMVGWAYWSWRYYADPTGSAAEGLMMADGRVRSTASVLSRVYPEAVAGTPRSISFDPDTDRFLLTYEPRRSAHGPTVVVVPTKIHYPDGYCARVSGARVVSPPTARLLRLENAGRAVVRLSVVPGRCAAGRPAGGGR
jgi:endoglycosylceramidase